MQLVEKHIINKNDPRWSVIDVSSFLSKNLYNAANYILRQEFIVNNRYISYSQLDKLMKHNPDYCALPRKVSQWVLKQVDKNWQSFFASIAEWREHPEKFMGRPKLPKYKHKTRGRNLLIYTDQAVSLPALKRGFIRPSQLDIEVKTKHKGIDQVRIIPRINHYVVEIVYTTQTKQAEVNRDGVLSLDLGVDTLVALTSNQPGFAPLLVNGRPLKSINHYYNQELARLKSALPAEQLTSKRIGQLTPTH